MFYTVKGFDIIFFLLGRNILIEYFDTCQNVHIKIGRWSNVVNLFLK
jgi:hypothetical protein